MPQSHHRKKHKEHLKHFKKVQEDVSGVSPSNKVSATWMFSIVGLAIGFAIGYFASGAAIWIAIGSIAGIVVGYYIGKRIDTGKV